MEEVLEVYTRPRDTARPLVCLDETSKQLIRETGAPLPMKRGEPRRVDYEVRTQRHRQSVHAVRAAGRLAACRGDGSPCRRRLCRHASRPVGPIFPLSKQDRSAAGQSQHPYRGVAVRRLRTAEARRLAERFEWHYTPKHGSWLDMAESELGVLSSQCLDRRIEDKGSLVEEVAAWREYRNKHHAKANWQFTNEHARIKLRRLYPSL